MMETMTECALWYWRHHAPSFDLCDDEQEAVRRALYLEDDGEGVPIGVQFRDGRTVEMADWAVYRAARDRRDADNQKRVKEMAAALKARPTRQIVHPFDGKPLTIDADEPEWVGMPEKGGSDPLVAHIVSMYSALEADGHRPDDWRWVMSTDTAERIWDAVAVGQRPLDRDTIAEQGAAGQLRMFDMPIRLDDTATTVTLERVDRAREAA